MKHGAEGNEVTGPPLQQALVLVLHDGIQVESFFPGDIEVALIPFGNILMTNITNRPLQLPSIYFYSSTADCHPPSTTNVCPLI